MGDKKNVIENLKKIKHILQADKNYSDEEIRDFLYIEKELNKRSTVRYKLPKELKNFLTFNDDDLLGLLDGSHEIPYNLKLFKDQFIQILEELQPTKEEDANAIISNISKGVKSLINHLPWDLEPLKYGLGEALKDVENGTSKVELRPEAIILTELAEQKLLDGTEDLDYEESSNIQAYVSNPFQFMPLYYCGYGDFIFYDLASAQLVCSDVLEWRILAPSFGDHIDDLIQGIDKGNYVLETDENIIGISRTTFLFPQSWYLRQLMKEGKYTLS